MLNSVIYLHFCHCIDDIMLEWYLLSFLMITIVFLFHFRGKLEFKLECELGFGFGFEYIWIWNGKNVNMLDQLILLVQLSDVSVTNSNSYS